MSVSANHFNLGTPVGIAASVAIPDKIPLMVHFGGASQRLMSGDIRIEMHGGHNVGDTLRIRVSRPLSACLLASDFATQWRRDGEPIHGENERTYTIMAEDAGHRIDCLVTDAKGLSSDAVCVE